MKEGSDTLLWFVHGGCRSTASGRIVAQHSAVRQHEIDEKAAGIAVPEWSSRDLDLVARLNCCGLPSGADQIRGRVHLEVPNLNGAFFVLNFHFDPRVRIRPLELFYGTFDGYRLRLIDARRRVMGIGRRR